MALSQIEKEHHLLNNPPMVDVKNNKGEVTDRLTIAVGTLVTGSYPNDSYPYEVVEVVSDKKIVVREMWAVIDPNWKPNIVTGGFGHCTNNSEQKWIVTTWSEGCTKTLTKRKNGEWVMVGQKYGDGMYFSFGTARRYHDYNL